MIPNSIRIATLIFAVALILSDCANNAVSSTPSIRVTSPLSSGTAYAGAAYDIQWNCTGDVDNTVTIDLYSDTGYVKQIAPSASNTGAYSWLVSTDVAGDTLYRIRIGGTTRTSVYGFSGVFTVVNNTDTYEPDGSASQATVLDTTGVPQKHRMSPPDTDWYKFDATAGRTYCIQTHGSANTFLQLFATNAFTPLATSANSSVGGNAMAVWTCISSGTYYFKISSPSWSSAAAYSIDIRVSGAILAITSPVSGLPSLRSSSTLSINWAYSANSGSTVSLYVFRNDSLVQPIAGSTTNDGNYSWTIPWTLPSSGAYRIRIVSDNDTSIHDQSDQFAITQIPSTLTITDPKSSTQWNTGSSGSIYWTSSGNFGSYVKLDLYDSTSYVMNITANSYLQNGYFSWTVPNSVGTSSRYRVKITSTTDTTVYDFSDPFTITKVPTTLSVTTPSSSTNWNTGSSYSVYWTYTGNPGTYVKLSLCDSSAEISAITSVAYATNGSYAWVVPPTIATGSYRIKISSIADSTILNYSSYFKITNVPTSITVTTPGKSTVWNVASTYSIYWSLTGSIGSYVTVSLYNDSIFVQTLSSSALASNGTYGWIVPSTLPGGSKYRIKVASYTYPSIFGFSDYFTIVQVPARLTITSPGTSSSWYTGTSYSIYWTSAGAPGSNVRLELYDSSRFTQTIVASASTANGYYAWLLPASLHTGNQYQIRISSTTHDTIFSMSNYFAITNIPVGITVSSPAPGNLWNAGSTFTVSWSSSGTIPGGYVSISLYDSTALLSVISSSTYRSNNYYSWAIPLTQPGGTKLRIKVASTTDTTIAGYSGAFSIVPAPTRLTVSTPDTTTSWMTGYSYTIYWSSTGSPGANVKLELYDTAGVVQTISSSTATTNGSQLWFVPTSLRSDMYRIKITSTATDSVYGFSKYFLIVNPTVTDSYEPDSTALLAKSITPGSTAQSHTLSSGDKDWMSFAATDGTTYTIETFGSTDTYMNLFSTDGVTLVSSNDDQTGSNTNARITWTCPATGTYYFEVTGSYGAVGNYTVSVH